MGDAPSIAPDSTAVRVALWRALHVEVDPTPHVHFAGDDFRKQSATAGLRFALFVPGAAPPPPVAPAPAPAPVPIEREFMVFFGFNQSNLTDEALATISQAVGAVHASGSAAISVVGHADRAGSIAYNKALSLRRAKSVRKAPGVRKILSMASGNEASRRSWV